MIMTKPSLELSKFLGQSNIPDIAEMLYKEKSTSRESKARLLHMKIKEKRTWDEWEIERLNKIMAHEKQLRTQYLLKTQNKILALFVLLSRHAQLFEHLAIKPEEPEITAKHINNGKLFRVFLSGDKICIEIFGNLVIQSESIDEVLEFILQT